MQLSNLGRRALRRYLIPIFTLPLILAGCVGETSTPSAATVSPATPAATAQAQVLGVSTAVATPTAAGTVAVATTPVAQATSQPAPACTPGARTTVAQTEGPYYRANPPQRASLLEPSTSGTKLTVSGYVLTPDCKPVPGARVDFWQADEKGQYDNSGYRMRGFQLTDANGAYRLETVLPGLYPGRTRHIHVKVQAPNAPILTTQLYFPNEPANAADGLFNAALVIRAQTTAGIMTGSYDFVVPGN